MVAVKSYREFRIEVRPSSPNGHEVRFLADGDDIIDRYWDDIIGLDPGDILVRPCPLHADTTPHSALVACCSCGVIGCDDLEVEIARSSRHVTWTWGSEEDLQTLKFPAASYEAEVERALSDTSWETPDRTAARLLAGKVDREILRRHGVSYCWGSGRVRQGMFTISLKLEPGPYQLLLHLPWSTESPGKIAQRCAKLVAGAPARWVGVEWYPQQPGLGPPAIAGPTWRRGGS